MPALSDYYRPAPAPFLGHADRRLQGQRADSDFRWENTAAARKYRQGIRDLSYEAAFSGFGRSGVANLASQRMLTEHTWDRLTRRRSLQRFLEDLSRAGILGSMGASV